MVLVSHYYIQYNLTVRVRNYCITVQSTRSVGHARDLDRDAFAVGMCAYCCYWGGGLFWEAARETIQVV